MTRRAPVTSTRSNGNGLRGLLPVLLPALLLALGSIAGCHVGNFSASIDSNSKLPQFEFSSIPSQSEPPVENIEGAEAIESVESDQEGASTAE
jgi:hypothetical protein